MRDSLDDNLRIPYCISTVLGSHWTCSKVADGPEAPGQPGTFEDRETKPRQRLRRDTKTDKTSNDNTDSRESQWAACTV